MINIGNDNTFYTYVYVNNSRIRQIYVDDDLVYAYNTFYDDVNETYSDIKVELTVSHANGAQDTYINLVENGDDLYYQDKFYVECSYDAAKYSLTVDHSSASDPATVGTDIVNNRYRASWYVYDISIRNYSVTYLATYAGIIIAATVDNSIPYGTYVNTRSKFTENYAEIGNAYYFGLTNADTTVTGDTTLTATYSAQRKKLTLSVSIGAIDPQTGYARASITVKNETGRPVRAGNSVGTYEGGYINIKSNGRDIKADIESSLYPNNGVYQWNEDVQLGSLFVQVAYDAEIDGRYYTIWNTYQTDIR